jgi:hypothetical protein
LLLHRRNSSTAASPWQPYQCMPFLSRGAFYFFPPLLPLLLLPSPQPMQLARRVTLLNSQPLPRDGDNEIFSLLELPSDPNFESYRQTHLGPYEEPAEDIKPRAFGRLLAFRWR